MGFVPTASRNGAALLSVSSPPSPLLHRHHRRVLDAKDGPPPLSHTNKPPNPKSNLLSPQSVKLSM
ncbi:hypothetical protein HanRHA438_Chr14g0640391 [Helianthus annuus]|uniref:Uncharacterized protein n=1 Tax=Helianthus annuus TaxID=4232 RepID=A0A251SF23_HELAN|nr:hypothetical protein HanXRQr2_Chr14g0629481 [Helianthus annuus]KAJ0467215.1 hypothetical protein HanIR_Chr14g0682861 [Helianthus annuus]KAJ0484670.1 hypothetical protein HanHA89_Chr14g0559451 [Helianthus annuus]KAJ0638613.1 hypothetical protein HanHA300_Chr00c0081g0705991 [Helianthus annuus]KAJ0655222.1 hypothetical protein HanLR1_Chr14g0521741 [Helianthus annuus]